MKLLLAIIIITYAFTPMYAQAFSQNKNNDQPIEITADKSLEWDRPNKIFTASQNALAVQGDISIAGDTIIAYYKETDNSNFDIWQIIAKGNVVITTKTESAKGSYGVYNAAANKVTLSGGVTLRRGQSILTGDKAEVDMNANTSRIISSTANNGARVRGIFYPESNNDTKEPAQ